MKAKDLKKGDVFTICSEGKRARQLRVAFVHRNARKTYIAYEYQVCDYGPAKDTVRWHRQSVLPSLVLGNQKQVKPV